MLSQQILPPSARDARGACRARVPLITLVGIAAAVFSASGYAQTKPVVTCDAAGIGAAKLTADKTPKILEAAPATAGKDTDTHKANPNAVKAMIAFICLNIASFATTWGPTAWIVIGEIFPLTIRSRGVGLSTASNWFWNCIIAVITPYLVSDQPHSANMGSNVFFMWGGLCIISFLFAYFFVSHLESLIIEAHANMSRFLKPRVSPSNRSTRCWRSRLPVPLASGSHTPPSLAK